MNIAFAVSAAMAEEVARFAQASNNETFLATAEAEGGEVLSRWIFDRYSLTIREAQAAAVTLRLTRTNLTPGVTVEAGSVFGTAAGVNFRIINDVVFAANNQGPLDVIAFAEQSGPQGNVAAGTITQVVSGLEDSTIAVSNPEPAAGGSTEETSSEAAARARDFFVNARRGTAEAIQTGALDTPGVQQATVIENIDPSSTLPNFRVQLIIADRDGQANSALATQVRQTLVAFRCLGVPVLVTAGTPEFVEISIQGLQFQSSVNTTAVLEEARNAVLAAVNGQAPGQTLEVATIIAALKSVNGLIVPANAVVVPAGDLVPPTGGVIRTTKDRIALNEAA